MTTFFDKQNSLCSDSCWATYKNYGNDKINNYQTYDTQLVDCEAPNVRMPTFMYDHINLRGRPGVGVSDPCFSRTSQSEQKSTSSQTKHLNRMPTIGMA